MRYDIDKKPESLADIVALIERAHEELSALCKGKRFRMSVPVDDADSDMVIGDALRHSLAFFKAALERHLYSSLPLDVACGCCALGPCPAHRPTETP
jgi:hypothetical protein